MSDETPLELWYFADPMCSWCWGFSPVVTEIARLHGDRAPIRVIMGGLAPGTRGVMTDDLKREIRSHWEHVHTASGQPFEFSFFDRDGFSYDTAPPSRGLAAARRLDQDIALPFLGRLHRAFYAEGKDITDAQVLTQLAVEAGLERDAYLAELEGDGSQHDMVADFGLARQLGVRGFPTLVGRRGEDLAGLSRGFRPLDAMLPAVDAWLSEVP